MEKCKEYEATVRGYICMANDNSQLQTTYQQGAASLDSNSFKKHTNKHKSKFRSNRSHSGSRECKPATPKHTGGSKCKRCGFEHHTTPDGSCQHWRQLVDFATELVIMNQHASPNAQNRREKLEADRNLTVLTGGEEQLQDQLQRSQQ